MRDLIGRLRQKEAETAELLLNTDLQKRNEELELEKVTRSPLTFSPNPAQNLQSAMNSVAPLDGTIVQQMIINSLATFRTERTQLLTQNQQNNTSRPISAATPLGATVSHGLPGLLQSPPISIVFGGASGNPTVVPNDYDKAVEVEQRKQCDPILTPGAIRS